MRTAVTMLAVWGLVVPSVGADDAKKDDTKKDPVREIKLTGYKAERPRGDVTKPVEIGTAEEMAKTFPDKEIQEQIKKEVNFDSEKLLFFAWSGSGQDKLSGELDKTSDKPTVMFSYKAGLTRDLRPHIHLYAVPKKATFKVGR